MRKCSLEHFRSKYCLRIQQKQQYRDGTEHILMNIIQLIVRTFIVDACASSKFRDLVRPSAAKNETLVYLKAYLYLVTSIFQRY